MSQPDEHDPGELKAPQASGPQNEEAADGHTLVGNGLNESSLPLSAPERNDQLEPGDDHGRVSLPALLKPMEVKRLVRVPYDTVIGWLTVGHPRAGILPSIDLAETRKRHSFRIRREDLDTFLARLQTVPKERQRAKPLPRPEAVKDKKGMFRY